MKNLLAKAKAWYKDLDEDTRTLVVVVAACFALLVVALAL